MKKSIFIILTIFLIITIAISYFLWESQRRVESANRINQEYNTYYDKTILGTDVASIINKTIDQNEKNKIVARAKRTISGATLLQKSLSAAERLLQREKDIKCTSIEYHEKTKYVKSLTFEQVQ